MNWPEVEQTLKTWFQGVLSGAPVAWKRQPTGLKVGHRHWGELSIMGDRGVGVDEVRLLEQEPGADLTALVAGNRQFTLTCEVHVRDQRAGRDAHAWLSKARSSLRWPSTLSALDAAGLALVRIEPLVAISEVASGRDVSRASMDVVLAGVDNSPDPEAIPPVEQVDPADIAADEPPPDAGTAPEAEPELVEDN